RLFLSSQGRISAIFRASCRLRRNLRARRSTNCCGACNGANGKRWGIGGKPKGTIRRSELINPRGSTASARVEKGFYVDKRDRLTRKVRWEQLDEDLAYAPNQLNRAVVAPDQIRTVIRTFRDRLFTEIFPGRTTVPKTLIFAKDDSHADDIVKIVREEF